MFWQFEDGRLVNLNIFEDIGFFEDAHTGVSHVRGSFGTGEGISICLVRKMRNTFTMF